MQCQVTLNGYTGSHIIKNQKPMKDLHLKANIVCVQFLRQRIKKYSIMLLKNFFKKLVAGI